MKHLKEDEKLLYNQRIVAPGHINKEAIKNQYAQRENRKLLGAPIAHLVSLYYGVWGTQSYNPDKYVRKRERIEKKFDEKIAKTTSQKKIDNYQFRKQKKVARMNSFIENGNLWMQWGEPITVFDSSLVTLTKERFSDYLFSKGFFTNTVTSNVDFRGQFKGRKDVRAHVTYTLQPGQPYYIDSIFYEVRDSTLLNIILNNNRNSHLQKGERYEQDNFTKERERLDLLMKDNGFYDFSRQYIEYDVDTTMLSPDRKVVVKIVINEPAKRGYHKQFLIDSIRFTTDAGVNKPGEIRQIRHYRDIQYNYFNDIYNLKILSQRVFLQPGQLYSRRRTLNTQRQLANVDAFKFINIIFDTTGGNFIANIYSSPLPRYEWSNEAGVNVTQGYPGPFYSISFRKRNIFRGLETFELNGRFGLEGVASATKGENAYRSVEAGVNASLIFPQFLFPFREATRFKLAPYNPKTKLTTGYAFTERPEYRRTAISVNGTYTWQNNRDRAYSLTPLNLSVINATNLSPAFSRLLVQQDSIGNFSLINSFRPSFVNSIIFGVTWNKNYGNVENNSSFVRAQIESGGTIWNWIDPKYVQDLDLEYFKYFRLSIDFRKIHVINPNTTVAYRIHSGAAYSYTKEKRLPYEKFFFAGGTNSIRAWRPRRLGPGSFKPDSSATPVSDGLFSYSIEKPAEILLEGSVELRQKLFGFVSGALFIDAGNVWTFSRRKKSITEEGEQVSVANGNSQFRMDQFYKEIAVGTGFGLRFDFSFLILRLDVGIKVYDPAREENDRFVLDEVRFWKPYASKQGNGYTDFREPVIYNVAIGYSF
ncbi:MAG TPA: BamA/TamA family outer membrane protein [Ohtaekwangia sp.]|nr:BamA/TamA family outer membrane protein [Ohtaekwangia sp.]